MTVKELMVGIALDMAADNRYGYSNAYPNNRFDDDTPFDGDCGAFCSFCLNQALKAVGINESRYYEPQGGWSIYNEAYLLKYCDRYDYKTTRNAVGDILISGGHTVMVTGIDPDMITHARNDDDGKSGDSGGKEILTQRLYGGNDYWHYIYRLKPEYNKTIPEPEPEPEPTPEGDDMFKDVDKNTSGYASIKWCYENGIVKGFSDGTFRPTDKITRAGVCIIAYRLFKLLYKLLKKA